MLISITSMSVLNRLERLDLRNEYKVQIFNEFVVDLNLVYPVKPSEKVFRNVLENWNLTRPLNTMLWLELVYAGLMKINLSTGL